MIHSAFTQLQVHPSEVVLGSIDAVAARSLQVGLTSVLGPVRYIDFLLTSTSRNQTNNPAAGSYFTIDIDKEPGT